VDFLDTEGNDLVCSLASIRVIEGWPKDCDLVRLVRALVLGLREVTILRTPL
jgi:hypothetical protein